MQKFVQSLDAASAAQPMYPRHGAVGGIYIPASGAWKIVQVQVAPDLTDEQLDLLKTVQGSMCINVDDTDDMDDATKLAVKIGSSYVYNKDSFMQANVCSKLFELAAGERGIAHYSAAVRAKGAMLAAMDRRRGVAQRNPFWELVEGRTGYPGYLDSAKAWIDDDTSIHMDSFFLGNDNYANGEGGNDMFKELAPNETVKSARGPLLVLFYDYVTTPAMPFTDAFMKHFSVTEEIVHDMIGLIATNVSESVVERLNCADLA